MGQRDFESQSVIICRRDNFQKISIKWENLILETNKLINDMHQNLYDKAKEIKDVHTKIATSFGEFIELLNNKNIVLVPFCGNCECEENIKIRSKEESIAQQTDETFELTGSAKSLCIPFDQPLLEPGTKCFGECGNNSNFWCLFGRSY